MAIVTSESSLLHWTYETMRGINVSKFSLWKPEDRNVWWCPLAHATRPGGRPYLQPPTQGTSRKHIISILSPSRQILSLISFYMASISMYFLIIILMSYLPSGSLTVCLAKWKMYTYNLEINQCQDVILVKSYLWGVGEMLEGDWDAHCLSAILGDEPFSSWSLNKSHICDILKSWI